MEKYYNIKCDILYVILDRNINNFFSYFILSMIYNCLFYIKWKKTGNILYSQINKFYLNRKK